MILTKNSDFYRISIGKNKNLGARVSLGGMSHYWLGLGLSQRRELGWVTTIPGYSAEQGNSHLDDGWLDR